MNSLVIAIAMEAEAKPFVEHLALSPADNFFPAEAPFLAFQGMHNDCHVTVVTNGKDTVHGTGLDNVGTVPAALATVSERELFRLGKRHKNEHSFHSHC